MASIAPAIELLPNPRHHAAALGQKTNRAVAVTYTVTITVAETPLLKTLVAGGVAGAVSRTLTAPLDRLKMLAQEGRIASSAALAGSHCSAAAATSCTSLPELVRHVYRNGGVKAFWRGNGVNCLKAGPEQAAAFSSRQFYLQSVCKDVKNPTFAENCIVGSLAGLTAQFLLYPMEVVKTRMAVADSHEYSSIADCFRQSVRRGGVRDLYVGLFANAAGIIPHRGLEMGTFFTLDRWARGAYHSNDQPPPLYVTMGISFAASLVSQVVTYPLNLARTKLQTQGVNGRPLRYRGLVHCLASVWYEQGARGWFAGIFPNMMKAVPASMLMYMTFSHVQNAVDSAAHHSRHRQQEQQHFTYSASVSSR